MPKRTNPFQKFIYDIKKQTAGSAIVTESKMLIDKITGDEREVDVVLETNIAGHDIIISIECVDRKRKMGVKWVEEMKTKHDSLPTDKLVLCSRTGFAKSALKKAEHYGIDCSTPISFEKLNWQNVFNRLSNSIYYGTYHLQITQIMYNIEVPIGDNKPTIYDKLEIFDVNGNLLGNIQNLNDQIHSFMMQLPPENKVTDGIKSKSLRLFVSQTLYFHTDGKLPCRLNDLDVEFNTWWVKGTKIPLQAFSIFGINSAHGILNTPYINGRIIITEQDSNNLSGSIIDKDRNILLPLDFSYLKKDSDKSQ